VDFNYSAIQAGRIVRSIYSATNMSVCADANITGTFLHFWTHKVHYKLQQSRPTLQNFDDGGLLSVHPAPDPAGGAHDAPPDPLVGWGGGHLSPRTPPPRRLQRLDPRAFGARCSGKLEQGRQSAKAGPAHSDEQ